MKDSFKEDRKPMVPCILKFKVEIIVLVRTHGQSRKAEVLHPSYGLNETYYRS